MFTWYKNSRVCLAYLEDVESSKLDDSFGNSVWWTRSWTLQELIAPKNVVFHNKYWRIVTDKSSSAAGIEKITSVPQKVLLDSDCLWEFGFGTKMSWASERQATRVEDIAYSLMGLFGIYMPLLYGEGKQAFIRLQEEIIRNSNAIDFLAWGFDEPTLDLLASSPTDFHYVRGVSPLVQSDDSYKNILCTLTNLGLDIDTVLIRLALNLYGIVLGRDQSLDNEIYVLLLRKHYRVREAFYKVAGIKLSNTWRPTQQEKNFTIMRGTKGQRIQWQHGGRFNDYSSIGQAYSLDIKCTNPFSFRTLPEKDQIGFAHLSDTIETARWNFAVSDQSLTAVWSKPSLLGYVNLTCQVSTSTCLLLEITFDFESRPCLMVTKYTDKTKKILFDPKRKTIYQICDEYQPLNHVSPSFDGRIEPRAVKTSEEVITPSFIVRALALRTFYCKLPPELVSCEEVFIEVYDTKASGSQSSLWEVNVWYFPPPGIRNGGYDGTGPTTNQARNVSKLDDTFCFD